MHDAMALANLIYAMPARTSRDITKIFEEYKSERYPVALDCYKSSKMMGKLIDSGFAGAFSLFIMTKMPQWMWRLVVRYFAFLLVLVLLVLHFHGRMDD